MRTTRSRIRFGGLALLSVPLLALFPLRNNDLWWHLATGRFMVASLRFPDLDPFSHTGFMGRWVDNEWLSELLFYGAWRAGGNSGLVLLRAALITAVFALVVAYLRAARRPSLALPALAVGIALSYSWWELRPSLFSLLGTVALLIVLEGARRGRLRAWTLPCIFLPWANLHPGFLFGLLVLAGSVAAVWIEPYLPTRARFSHDSSIRVRLSIASAIAALSTLINPYGVRVFGQQFAIAGNLRYRELLDEWAPPSAPFLLLALVAVGAFLLLRFRRVPLATLVPILGAALLSMTGVRFVEYFAVVAAPAMLAHLGPLRRRDPRGLFLAGLLAGSLAVGFLPPMGSAHGEAASIRGGTGLDAADLRLLTRTERIAAGLCALTAASLLVALVERRWTRPFRIERLWRSGAASAWALGGLALAALILAARPLPADGVERGRYPSACLAALPDEARPFNKLSWGGWLLWKRGVRTYIDGRCWGQPIFFESLAARGASWKEILERRGIDAVILPPLDPLLERIAGSDAWEQVCDDGVSRVYRMRRESTASRPRLAGPSSPGRSTPSARNGPRRSRGRRS
jgi:hypothetical protein